MGKLDGRTAGEVAIAWTLHNPAVTAAIVGVRSREQVRGIIRAAEYRLNAAQIRQLEEAVEHHRKTA
jgi:aryl-alcohol dehydrogenase-like predicted oxidoreductase